MRKVFTLMVVLVLCMNYSKGQVRLSEVYNKAGENYIEAYTPSSTPINLDGYFFLTKVQGFANWNVLPLDGTTIGGTEDLAKYLLLTQTTPNSQTPYTHSDLVSSLSSNFLEDNKSAFVFLIDPNNKVVDLFSAHSSQKAATTEIQSFGLVNFSVNGQSRSVNFSRIEVSQYQFCVMSQLGASSSYSLTNAVINVCGTWLKTSGNNQNNPGRTPEAINQNALSNPDFFYFTHTIKYDQTLGAPQNWTELNELQGLPSQNGSNLSTSTNFEMLFRYEITNTNLTSISSSNPMLEIWVDQNEDKIFIDDINDPAKDLQLIVGTDFQVESINSSTYAFRLLNPAGAKIKIDVSNSHNLFLKFKTSGSTCFEKISELVFQAGALPVNLKNFVVDFDNNATHNFLKWITSSETNNKGFEIQRSIGSTNGFRTIGFVGTRAKDGNSQTEISYSFEDVDVKAGQTHYYRLNQIDFDGKSAFSPVKSIKPGSIESNLNVYPNPSQGSFTVNTGSNSGKLNIFVMDNTGRVVNQFMNVSTSNTRINNLKKGFYTLKIVNTESGEQSAQRVVVQ